MAAVRTFSAKDYLVNFVSAAGALLPSGFAPDDFISVEPSGPSFEPEQGADGDLSMIQKPVYYTVKLSLSQTSPSNAVLSAIMTVDELSGAGVGQLTLKDGRGTSLVELTGRWTQRPTAAVGTTAKTREWTFVGVGLAFIGGN